MSPNAEHVNNCSLNGGTGLSMTGMQSEKTISIHLTTFNCANFSHPRFPIAFPPAPPDVLVLGLQELAPSHIAFLNLRVVEDTYLKGLELVSGLAQKQYGIEYELVEVVRVGQTALAIWSSLGRRLKRVQTAWAGCGLFGLLANKGAAATRLTIDDGGKEREVTFVAAHLAAHEGHFHRRNADFQCLVQNLVFKDQSGIFRPHVPLFFLGDLNYRLSVLHPSRSGSKMIISTNEDIVHDDTSLIALLKENILDFLETGKFSHLRSHDQLPLSPLALHLHEAPITFSPTYKYTSHNPPTYTTRRTPSWTDRILYSPETIMAKDYKSITCVTFSDHQAVSLSATLRDEDFECEEGFMPWDINPNWRERRELGEKLAYAVGAIELVGERRIKMILLIAIILSGIALYMFF